MEEVPGGACAASPTQSTTPVAAPHAMMLLDFSTARRVTLGISLPLFCTCLEVRASLWHRSIRLDDSGQLDPIRSGFHDFYAAMAWILVHSGRHRGSNCRALDSESGPTQGKVQLDELFELSPDAVILTGEDFHVLRVNKEFTRISGYTAEEVAGQWLPDLIVPEELRPEALKDRERLISANRVELEAIRERKAAFALTFPLWQRPFRSASIRLE